MRKTGFIKIYRKSLESKIWNKPPMYWKVWTYILMNAAYEDTSTLKKGTFITTMPEIIEAVSWNVGYRKESPTYKQVRDILEFLKNGDEKSENTKVITKGQTKGQTKDNTKVKMIDVTKVKGGMLIKVLNYAQYQQSKTSESKNEGHNEGQYESHTKGNMNEFSGAKQYKRNIKNIRIKNNIIPYHPLKTGDDVDNDFADGKKETKKGKDGKEDEKMISPSLDEVRQLQIDEVLNVNPYQFFEFYESKQWCDQNGNPIKDWKSLMRAWSKPASKEVTDYEKSKSKYLSEEEWQAKLDALIAKYS